MLFTAFLLFITGCHIILHRPVCYQQSRILRTQPKSSYLYLYYIWYRIFYNQPKTSVNILFFYIFFQVLWLPKEDRQIISCRLRLKYDGSRVETRFRLLAKRRSPFKSAGASVQSTTGSRGVRISGSNAGYTMFRGSVKSTGYPLHSPVFPSLPPYPVPSHFSWTLSRAQTSRAPGLCSVFILANFKSHVTYTFNVQHI